MMQDMKSTVLCSSKRVSMIVVEPAAGSQGPAADDDEPRSDEQDGESASPQGE